MRRVLPLLACLLLCATATPASQSAQPAPDPRLDRALAALAPQRPDVVDSYLVVVALDSDPVFNTEARESARVLARRFAAEGRTILLARDDGTDRTDGAGTPANLAAALERVGATMDRKRDVLILYSTSHGSERKGLNYRDEGRDAAVVTPDEMRGWLDRSGADNRLVILQACFSGQFVPKLATATSVIATASSSMHSSFGCSPANDWTFFGHALINRAMRQPDTFVRQFRRAWVAVDQWERKLGIDPSSPQISVGAQTAGWLAALDAHAPKSAGTPVGRPPLELVQ